MTPGKIVITILVIIVIIVSGIGGYKLLTRPKHTNVVDDALTRMQPLQLPAGKARLADWENFTSIPVIDECLLTADHSCFPIISFSPDSFGGGWLTFTKASNQYIDVPAIRSLLLGDESYKDSLLIVPPTQLNATGLQVDDMINPATTNNINPLVISEILKLVFAPEFSLSGQPMSTSSPSLRITIGIQEFEPQVIQSLVRLYTDFSAGSAPTDDITRQHAEAYKALSERSLSPMQKAIVFYFYTQLTKATYLEFVKNFNKSVPATTGKLPMQIASTLEMWKEKPQKPTIVFCDSKTQNVFNCQFAIDTMICLLSPDRTVCGANYTLNR